MVLGSKARLMFNTQSSSSEETYVSSQGSDEVFTVAGKNYMRIKMIEEQLM